MLDRVLSYIAPHYCSGCGISPMVLCDYCKYNIVDEPYEGCVACGHLAGVNGICAICTLPYERAWCVGERSGIVEKIINDYKFHNQRVAYRALGDLLLARIDDLPPNTVIIPVPTVRSHIRQRGYDHMLLIAKYVAKKRGLRCEPILLRVGNTKQRDASRAQRLKQAKEAFTVQRELDGTVPYLLIDDVVTTGATIHYGAEALRKAGARHVWVGAVARQPRG